MQYLPEPAQDADVDLQLPLLGAGEALVGRARGSLQRRVLGAPNQVTHLHDAARHVRQCPSCYAVSAVPKQH